MPLLLGSARGPQENPSGAERQSCEGEERTERLPFTHLEAPNDAARAGMFRLNPECWVWSPRPRVCPQHSGSLVSGMPSHQEEDEEEEEEEEEKEEEEAGEHPAARCYTTSDVVSQAADAQWSISGASVRSGIPGSSGIPAGTSDPEGDRGDVSQRGGRRWERPAMETQGCVCVHGQRDPEGLGPCWPGSPYAYYGLRRSLVVGVEVVEEIAVEDTLEVITGDVYTDELLDAELLRDDHLFPT